ncbi:MAG: TasA family protein [Tissierellales bacterium]
MSKKALLSLLLIGVLAFGAGLGTFAWFTSQATSTDNVFETGTLIIGENEEIEHILTVENIYPSWESEVKEIEVKNTGSLEFKYRMSVEALIGNLLYDGTTPLQVKVDNGEFTDINDLGYVELGTIKPSETGTFEIQFRLPQEADNEYQDAQASITFVFDATQVNNETWTE